MRKKISVKSQVNRAHEGKGPFEKDRGQTYVIYIVQTLATVIRSEQEHVKNARNINELNE